jgi:hypothetical protein
LEKTEIELIAKPAVFIEVTVFVTAQQKSPFGRETSFGVLFTDVIKLSNNHDTHTLFAWKAIGCS